MPNPPNRRGTDPYARWCGRGGVARRPPIPIEPALASADPTPFISTPGKAMPSGQTPPTCCTAQVGSYLGYSAVALTHSGRQQVTRSGHPKSCTLDRLSRLEDHAARG